MNLSMTKTYEYCGADLECKITSFVIDGENNMEYTTYGIRIENSSGETVYERQDISTDRSLVENFAALCETHFVSILHIGDVLEDYLF